MQVREADLEHSAGSRWAWKWGLHGSRQFEFLQQAVKQLLEPLSCKPATQPHFELVEGLGQNAPSRVCRSNLPLVDNVALDLPDPGVS